MRQNFFDYIYYRLTQFYYKWDGRTGITAILGISMVQCLVLFDIFLIFERFFYTKKEIVDKGDARTVAYIAVGCFFILAAYNYKKYQNKYNSFKALWKNESKIERQKKGFLVVLCLTLPWLPLIFLGLH